RRGGHPHRAQGVPDRHARPHRHLPGAVVHRARRRAARHRLALSAPAVSAPPRRAFRCTDELSVALSRRPPDCYVRSGRDFHWKPTKMHRRRFLQQAGCAICAAGAEHLLRPMSSAAAAEAYAKLDPAARLNLADMAIELAKRAGASYADVRIGRTEEEFLRARERRLDNLNSTHAVGVGVRLLLDGSWGFAGSELIDEAEVRRTVALAVENARASRPIPASPIVLESLPAYHDDWRMPMQVDPFAVSTHDKAAKLIAINEAALKAGADYCTASMWFVREEKLFASSAGSRITQTRVRSAPNFEVTAIDKQTGRFASRSTLAAPR